MIEVKIILDVPYPDEETLSTAIENIGEFVKTQFPKIRTPRRMNSPVRVSIKIISEHESQEGELPSTLYREDRD